MRLIDADALDIVYEDGNDTLVRNLDEVPTIDAVEVVHGEWIVDDEFIDCSVCRCEKWSRMPFESLVKRFRYCPKCGAKMDGEEKNDGE